MYKNNQSWTNADWCHCFTPYCLSFATKGVEIVLHLVNPPPQDEGAAEAQQAARTQTVITTTVPIKSRLFFSPPDSIVGRRKESRQNFITLLRVNQH